MLKIGVQSAPWYRNDDPDASIKFIKECGFETIDFNIDGYLPGDAIRKGVLTDFFDKSVEELCEYFTPLKTALEKYGVTVSQMHAPFPLFVKDREDINSYLIQTVGKVCGVCAYLGCQALVVHPVSSSNKETEICTNLDMYRAMTPYAKKYGVMLCLENLFTSFNGRHIEGPCSCVDEAVMYIDKLNEEAGAEVFGFCLDVGHANILGRKLHVFIQKLGSRLKILHIHDNNGTEDLHMMPYTYTRNWGKDLICDWEGFITGLKDIGYKGDLCFETFRVLGAFPPELRGDALKLISSIGRYFKSRLEK